MKEYIKHALDPRYLIIGFLSWMSVRGTLQFIEDSAWKNTDVFLLVIVFSYIAGWLWKTQVWDSLCNFKMKR